MNFLPNRIYHVYNQGNDRQKIFFNRSDYVTFLNLYRRLFPVCCSTIAWCLMPNHFHFMIYTDERCLIKIKQGGIFIDPITNNVRKLLSGYARIFNHNYKRSGSVFRQKTKINCLSETTIIPSSANSSKAGYINCFRYIHQNPLKANLVSHLQHWEFSSFLEYADIKEDGLCDKELAELYCEYDKSRFLKEQ